MKRYNIKRLNLEGYLNHSFFNKINLIYEENSDDIENIFLNKLVENNKNNFILIINRIKKVN